MERRILFSSLVAFALVAGLVAGVSTPVSAATAIQPGARISSDGNGCTMNFIYREIPAEIGDAAVFPDDPYSEPSESDEGDTTVASDDEPALYAGTAGHCVERIGARVSNRDGSFGTVAFRVLNDSDDFAFIEIDRDKEHLVNPRMLGFNGPNGTISGSEARRGDAVHVYGQGLIFGETELTRPRSGTLTRSDAHRFAATLPVIFGDSGGPVLHRDGAALGIVAHLVIAGDLTTLDGNTVERALAVASAGGLDLEVVPG